MLLLLDFFNLVRLTGLNRILASRRMHIIEKAIVYANAKVFGVYEFLRPTLWVSDPDVLRNILSKDFHMFTNRRVSYF